MITDVKMATQMTMVIDITMITEIKMITKMIGLVCLGFTARSTFVGYMEPRQKPVAGMTLLLLAKHDKGSLKCVSPKTV